MIRSRGSTPPARRLASVLASTAALACLLAGCVLARSGGADRSRSERPASAKPAEEPDMPEATASVENVAPPPAPSPETQPGDYWLERFGDYMQPAERELYLATPPAERYDRFADRILEWQRREALLEPYRDRLTPEEIAAYRRLPDLPSARAWLAQRFGEQ
ncbi:MAG: hypothetical protein D6776_08205 [Planctomycetota bacterium]|nr:MAG: hypothetical protein D6776_08205 [Planctomycetota bacterium]